MVMCVNRYNFPIWINNASRISQRGHHCRHPYRPAAARRHRHYHVVSGLRSDCPFTMFAYPRLEEWFGGPAFRSVYVSCPSVAACSSASAMANCDAAAQRSEPPFGFVVAPRIVAAVSGKFILFSTLLSLVLPR